MRRGGELASFCKSGCRICADGGHILGTTPVIGLPTGRQMRWDSGQEAKTCPEVDKLEIAGGPELNLQVLSLNFTPDVNTSAATSTWHMTWRRRSALDL